VVWLLTHRLLQVAYWWVVHAGPLSCGPDRETVEKGLLERHKLEKK
jgi:hypothetical protein